MLETRRILPRRRSEKLLLLSSNAWVAPIKTAGYIPGLYVGSGALLDSKELYALGVVRYWQSLSKEIDARGEFAEPSCGWCMIQLYPSVSVAGVWVDVDVVQKDYRGRLPAWVVAAPSRAECGGAGRGRIRVWAELALHELIIDSVSPWPTLPPLTGCPVSAVFLGLPIRDRRWTDYEPASGADDRRW